MACFTIAAACGGNDGDDAPPGATQTAPSPPASATAPPGPDVSGALLRASDLGEGYIEVPLEGFSVARNYLCGVEAPAFQGDLSRSSVLQNQAQGRFALVEIISVYADEAAAAAVIAQFREQSANCTALVSTNGRVRTDWSVAPATFERFGDDTVALRGTAEIGGQTATAHFVLIQRGRYVIGIADAVGGSDASTLETIEIARTADRKLANVIGD
jgi:hypothetical protein